MIACRYLCVMFLVAVDNVGKCFRCGFPLLLCIVIFQVPTYSRVNKSLTRKFSETAAILTFFLIARVSKFFEIGNVLNVLA